MLILDDICIRKVDKAIFFFPSNFNNIAKKKQKRKERKGIKPGYDTLRTVLKHQDNIKTLLVRKDASELDAELRYLGSCS